MINTNKFSLILVVAVWYASSEMSYGGESFYRYPARNNSDMCRSGNANFVKSRSTYTYDERYKSYYVGGGSAFYNGGPRTVQEGTFGVDYAPFFTRVNLQWNHGKCYQDGRGLYEPDHHNRPFNNFSKSH